ncbi:MAG: N-acetyl-gamma-glutamyl-phosphate reductase [Thermoprotei archaeon]|nr:N-acetyl-gamma-glutamyl-phosphate reductase [Thermoprotei archaeon]
MTSVRVAVIGASGYTGGELLRILALHPHVEVTTATSREHSGKPLHYVHFNLRGFYRGLRFSQLDLDKVSRNSDVVFTSLPHGVSVNYVPKLLEAGLKVVDLSADFRLKNPLDYKTWYGYEHPYPDLLEKAVYGLPELHREELRGAHLIASPGCNATAAIIALAPQVKAGLVDVERIIVDIKAGSSEGGSNPTMGSHHPEREGTMRPYEAEGHRHAAEVVQELSSIAGRHVTVSLIPHSVGAVRGVLASAHSWLLRDAGPEDVMRAYLDFYLKEPFIRIVRGAPPGYPDPKYVVGSNFADVGFALEARVRRVTGFAAIDNLVKGAAGQAVQAFNIMMGFEETEGLKMPPLKPA